MKKIVVILLLVICMSALLTGCYTCDICREEKLIFDKNNETVLGIEVSFCGDCKDKLGDLADAVNGSGQ